MSQTVEELVALGLSEAEAKRVINRKAKAEEKATSSKALAEKRLPKAQEILDHANERAMLWAGRAAEARAKVEKYKAIISGESTEELPAEEPEEISEEVAEVEVAKVRTRAKR
jgi:hypothetical protein